MSEREARPHAGAVLDVAGSGPVGPAPDAASTSGGEPTSRTLSLLAADGVAYLVHWLVVLILLVQAAVLVLSPPDGSLAVGIVAGLVCLLWSAFELGMGLLRGSRPDGADRPPPGWLPAVASTGCLISLILLRTDVGQSDPWSAEFGTAALLVASVTVWRGEWVGGAVGVVLGSIALVWPAAGAGDPLAPTTLLQQSVPGVVLIAASFTVALALRWVRRGAQQLQESVDSRDELWVRERAVQAAGLVAAELERSLHDTALNTLETVAAHGAHLDADAVVARCRSDVDQLARWRTETGVRGFEEVLLRLAAHADRLGLDLAVDRVGPPPGSELAVQVPGPVLHAFAGAASEALTNVAKHAGVDRAALLVVSSDASLQVLVSDRGVGLGSRTGGYGVVSSVTERMQAAGGTAVVGPGPAGQGTVVALAWQPEPEEPAEVGRDLRARIAGVVVGVGTLLAGVGTALAVLGWSSYAHPWAALAAPVIPVLIAAWLRTRAQVGERIGVGQVALTCGAYLALGALVAFADAQCSADLGQGLLLDLRAPMAITLLLLVPRGWVLSALLATVIGAHLAGAVAQAGADGTCGPRTAAVGLYLAAALVAVWLFAQWIERASAAYERAHAESVEAEARILARISVRAEEELWVADTLASAQALLSAIADGTKDPEDPATRVECAAQAAFLRGLLAVGRAPDRLRRSARIWLRLLHGAGCEIRVRGAFVDCAPPRRVVGQVGGVLDSLSALAPGARVTLASWPGPETGSITVTAEGGPVAQAGEGLRARVVRVAGETAWVDVADDSLTVEWSWPTRNEVGAGAGSA